MAFLFFFLGLFFGSFFNVVIYRVPRNLSIVFPGSRCPVCAAAIRWYQNIPLFSYLLLKGKCVSCKTPISVRYPLVELAGGLIFMAGYFYGGLSLETCDMIFFVSALFLVTVIDFAHMIIPWEVLVPAFVWRLFYNLDKGILGERALSFLLFFALIWLIAFVGRLIYKKEAMGGGDIYYTAFLAFFVGWKSGVLLLLLAAISAALAGYLYAFISKKNVRETFLPFGPFLSLGAFAAYFWGEALLAWYTGLLPLGG
ncbi:MAG TPA: prepilin peptidase [Firmicutes bacterium]|nr:prepilin peptidase [Bacillota bacterium]